MDEGQDGERRDKKRKDGLLMCTSAFRTCCSPSLTFEVRVSVIPHLTRRALKMSEANVRKGAEGEERPPRNGGALLPIGSFARPRQNRKGALTACH